MYTITPLATAATLAAHRTYPVHAAAAASHAQQLTGAAGIAVVVAVLFLVTLTKALRRAALLVEAFLQLAAALTSVIFTMVAVATVAVVLLIR